MRSHHNQNPHHLQLFDNNIYPNLRHRELHAVIIIYGMRTRQANCKWKQKCLLNHFTSLFSALIQLVTCNSSSSWFLGKFSSNTSNVHVCLVSKVFFFSIFYTFLLFSKRNVLCRKVYTHTHAAAHYCYLHSAIYFFLV